MGSGLTLNNPKLSERARGLTAHSKRSAEVGCCCHRECCLFCRLSSASPCPDASSALSSQAVCPESLTPVDCTARLLPADFLAWRGVQVLGRRRARWGCLFPFFLLQLHTSGAAVSLCHAGPSRWPVLPGRSPHYLLPLLLQLWAGESSLVLLTSGCLARHPSVFSLTLSTTSYIVSS